jgi:hypothetical protein
MNKKKLVIQHDLSQLNAEQLEQYKRDVSEFIGLDPDLNGLDTIWMPNETGPGKSLVLYARRGTAEILRNLKGIEVDSLEDHMVQGSLVYNVTGHDKTGRHERAVGSKFIQGLTGKALDDAIMTGSTRALRRLTMQFTSLGILDESEVQAILGDISNPASSAQLAGSPLVLPPSPQVAPNNAPGCDITEKQVDIKADMAPPVATISGVPTTLTIVPQPDIQADTEPPAKPRRGRRPKNTVSIATPEPETVKEAVVPQPPQELPSAPTPTLAPPPQVQVNPAVPPQVNSANDFPGKPNEAQMADYRKRVSVYTAELPSSENMGSVQKMRAFITKQTGSAPQHMTVEQWSEMLSWFESFVERNKMSGLVKYINDNLGLGVK